MADVPKCPARKAVQNKGLHIRASETLLDKVAFCADGRGVSTSEFIRHAISAHVDRMMPHPETLLSKRDSLHRRASQGDLEAQRAYVSEVLIASMSIADPYERADMISEAELWAGAAAANGTHEDFARLIHVTGIVIAEATARGDERMRRQRETRAIGLLSVLANEGDDEAAHLLVLAAECADAEQMKSAANLVASWEA